MEGWPSANFVNCILEVIGSNPGRDNNFLDFIQFLYANVGIVPR
jgi:hypothetical protein